MYFITYQGIPMLNENEKRGLQEYLRSECAGCRSRKNECTTCYNGALLNNLTFEKPESSKIIPSGQDYIQFSPINPDPKDF